MLLKEMLEEYQNDVAYNLPFGEVTLTGARQVYFEIRAKYVNLAHVRGMILQKSMRHMKVQGKW